MNILLKVGLFICFLIGTTNLFSQDILIYKNGDELKVRVLRITDNELIYKKYININGPEYTEEKMNIFMIKYENGTKDIFKSNSKKPNNTNIPSNISCKHESDTILYINNKYIVVCKDCQKKKRYATIEEVKSMSSNSNGIKMPCGERPQAPPTYNNPQYKKTPNYKAYYKKLRIWRNCTGN